MAKFTHVISDIEGVFASAEWQRGVPDSDGRGNYRYKQVQAFPANFTGGRSAEEFVLVEVIPSRPNVAGYFNNLDGVGGIAIIQIYAPAGQGSRRSAQIADFLDTLLANQVFPRGTSTGTSSLSFLGIDNDDESLFRADYQVSIRNYNL